MTPQIEDYIMPVHTKLKNVWLIFLWSLFRGVYPGGSLKIVIFSPLLITCGYNGVLIQYY